MEFSELVDIGELQDLCASFTTLTGAATAILDLEGEILVAAGWQDICTGFHRAHPVTACRCRESDTVLAGQLGKGERYNVYKCKNGLVDVAVPITIGGEHVANLFTGQFFFEPPDKEYFIRQAEEFGFDKTAYLDALSRVPIYTEDQVKAMMGFFSRLACLIGEMGLGRKSLRETNQQLQQQIDAHPPILEALRLSEEKYRTLVENINDVIFSLDAQGFFTYISPAIERFAGYEVDQVVGQPFARFVHPADLATLQTSFERTLTGNLEPYEFRVFAQDGAVLHVRTSSRPLWEGGQLVGLTGIMTDVTARVRAESQRDAMLEALRESEERLRTLINGMPDIVCFKDGQGRWLEANAADLELFELQGVDYRGKKDSELAEFSSFYRDAFLACEGTDEKAWGVGSLSRGEEAIPCPDGTVKAFDVLKMPLFYPDGKRKGLIVLGRDITERKQAEEALRLDESRLKALLALNQMTEASLHEITDFCLEEGVRLTKSKLGYLAFMNEDETVLTMHSWSKEAMAQCAISDKLLVYPVATTGLWGEAVRQRQPVITNDYAAPNPLKKGYPPGHVRVTRHMNVPVFDGERIVAVAGVGNKEEDYDESDVRQLTLLTQGMWRLIQRRRAAEALMASEANYREIFSKANDAIFVHDIETGAILDVNQSMCEMYGYTPDQVRQIDVGTLSADVPPYTQEDALKWIKKAIDGKPQLFDWLARDKAGKLFWVEVNLKRARIGAQDRLLALVRDIGDRKQAEDELKKYREHLEDLVQERTVALEDANAELSQYAYVVSHDLRAPLRAIHNYADFLREDLADMLEGDQKTYLDGLRRAVHEAGDMVEDLLKLSRLDQHGVRPETIDLGTFLRDLIASLHLPAEVEVVMGADWPTLDAEPTLLRQIFQNLIDNAVKFNASPHKQVELGWRPAGEEAYEVFVRDNGIGIAPRHHEQIFRLFERLHTREEYEGTGVGLAIVKKAAGRLRGSVRIESEPDQGSTFFVTLPKAQKEREEHEQETL